MPMPPLLAEDACGACETWKRLAGGSATCTSSLGAWRRWVWFSSKPFSFLDSGEKRRLAEDDRDARERDAAASLTPIAAAACGSDREEPGV